VARSPCGGRARRRGGSPWRRPPAVTAAYARSGGADGGAGEKECASVHRANGRAGFCSAETRARPSILVQQTRSTHALSGFFRPRRDGELTARAQVTSRAAASARVSKKESRPLTGRLPWAATRAVHFPRWAAAHKKGRAGWIQRKHSASVFIFSKVIFNRISMNLMHFKFKFD
jgi:hypothetical protein